MQDHPVAAEQLVQHIVGLMHKLGQMRGALLIDRLRNEQDVPQAQLPPISANRTSRAAAVLRQRCGRLYFVFPPRFLSVIPVYLSLI